MKRIFSTLLAVLVVLTFSYSQEKYDIATVGFYNVENLFDTIDAPDIEDEEFLPEGENNWNTERYQKKLDQMSRVISEIGTDNDPNGIDILGISEVENLSVILDLVNQEKLKDRRYQVIHGDSPDERGIDVALIFNPRVFIPMGFELLNVELYNSDSTRDYTRDILYVKGKLQNEELHLFINHWPSRSGGQAASAHKRIKAAKVCRAKIDSIRKGSPDAKIAVLGDFNDDPISPSVKNFLKAQGDKSDCKKTGLYNPMEPYFHRGSGTNAYRDAWNLFDQVIISCPLLFDMSGYHFLSAHIFKKKYLLQKFGAYKGYPFRTYVGSNYMGGYSDHFPVYMHLVRKHEAENSDEG